jgi:hypothetical protein
MPINNPASMLSPFRERQRVVGAAVVNNNTIEARGSPRRQDGRAVTGQWSVVGLSWLVVVVCCNFYLRGGGPPKEKVGVGPGPWQ